MRCTRPRSRLVLSLSGALLMAGLSIGCQHSNGTNAKQDPNEPGSYDRRPHAQSGPGFESQPIVPLYGSEYGKPVH